MTILGKVNKQPREVKTYSVQFAEDMSQTDSLTGGYVALALPNAIETDLTGNYTVTQADNNALFYTGFNVTLPLTAVDGFVIMVSNIDQDSSIVVGAFNVAARCCIVVRRKNNAWVSEVSATTIVVSAPSDHRIRASFLGGINGVTYKAQMTAITSEGEVLEDEIMIKIKEI